VENGKKVRVRNSEGHGRKVGNIEEGGLRPNGTLSLTWEQHQTRRRLCWGSGGRKSGANKSGGGPKKAPLFEGGKVGVGEKKKRGGYLLLLRSRTTGGITTGQGEGRKIWVQNGAGVRHRTLSGAQKKKKWGLEDDGRKEGNIRGIPRGGRG